VRLPSDDEQFAAAKPDDAVTAAAGKAGRLPRRRPRRLGGLCRPPALGSGPSSTSPDSGRTTAKLLRPASTTVSYGGLWERVQALGARCTPSPSNRGPYFAILGFTSATTPPSTSSLRTRRGVGAANRPVLRRLAATDHRRDRTRRDRVSIDFVDDAVELILAEAGGSDSGAVSAGPAPAA